MLCVFLLCSFTLAADNVPQEINEKIGDMEFHYDPANGVRLNVFGSPVIKDSSFWVVKPNWTGHIYGTIYDEDFIKRAEIKKSADKIEITLHHHWQKGKESLVNGTETFVITRDNTYSDAIEFTYSGESNEAHYEWSVGNFYALPYIGRPYSLEDVKGKSSGLIPLEAKGNGISSIEESTLATNFTSMKIDSLWGPVEIIPQKADENFLLMDYRKNRWAKPGVPLFWMGVLDKPVEPGKHYAYGITLKFPAKPAMNSQPAPGITYSSPLLTVPNAQAPYQDPKYIIPEPKSLQFTREEFPLNGTIKIFIGKNPPIHIQKAVEYLTAELKDKYQVSPIVLNSEPAEPTKLTNAIMIGESSRWAEPAKLCNRSHIPVPPHKEGYSLLVAPRLVILGANNEMGIRNGIMSLAQLVKVSSTGVSFKCAKIRDYPSLDYRCIHFYTAKDKGDEQARFIKDLVARYKSNQFLWSCEAIKWDSHPEIFDEKIGMTKEDAKKVIDACRDFQVEPSPCISAFGHTDWMFKNGQHLDLAEDTVSLHTYCPDKPESYQMLFDIYHEAIDLMQPKYFNIVESELEMAGTTYGKDKKTSLCQDIYEKTGKSDWEILFDDINKVGGWLKKQNITPMIWGDMFLCPQDDPDATNCPDCDTAKWVRSQIPKYITIGDWHYCPAIPDDYESLGLFQKEGLKTIGCTWYTPDNIRNFTLAAIKNKSLGVMQTTWAGTSPRITEDTQSWEQFCSYILSAHYAWSGDTTLIEDLPFDAGQVFIDNWLGKKPVLKPRTGFIVDMKNACNRTLADDSARTGWVGNGHELDMSSVPAGTFLYGETLFKVQTNAKGNTAAIMLSGRINPPGRFPEFVSFKLNNSLASELHFLMTASFQENDASHIGDIKVKYEDGTENVLPLVYNKNIWSYLDPRIGQNADCLKSGRVAWKAKAASGRHVELREVVWSNPQPAKKIASVTLSSANTIASPILLSITGVR
jgi:hypothetical protein